MRVRRFNDAGLERMGEFIDLLTTDSPQSDWASLLSDDSLTEEVAPATDIEAVAFADRFEAARYLDERFSTSGLTGVETDTGLWAWLALFYLDVLCPADGNGRRKPRERARMIPEFGRAFRYYRHLLAGPYLIYRAHRDNPDRALALLCQPLDKPGDIVGQLAARQEIVSNKAIMEIATRLYVDVPERRPKRGSGGKGRGSPRRLAQVLDQFSVTWDLYAMSVDDLINMLPDEFRRFEPAV
jgi:hypothetical protein